MLPSPCFLITKLYCFPIFRANFPRDFVPSRREAEKNSFSEIQGVPGREDEHGKGVSVLRAWEGSRSLSGLRVNPRRQNAELFHLLVAPYRPRPPSQQEPCRARACILAFVRISLDLRIHPPFPEGLRTGTPLRDFAQGIL